MIGVRTLMKQVVSYIKKMFIFVLIWCCVFQMGVLLFTEPQGEEAVNEIEILQQNTSHIIEANPSVCTLIRDEKVFNDEGEVISYNRIERNDVIVRLSIIEGIQEKESAHGSEEIKKVLALTAKHNEDIKIGDVLKDDAGFYYKVRELNNITLGGRSEEFCYKKSGFAECFVL